MAKRLKAEKYVAKFAPRAKCRTLATETRERRWPSLASPLVLIELRTTAPALPGQRAKHTYRFLLAVRVNGGEYPLEGSWRTYAAAARAAYLYERDARH